MLHEKWRMFVPACGEGSRVRLRGRKPFLKPFAFASNPLNSLELIFNMVPREVPCDVALRFNTECEPIARRGVTVHFMEQTNGQADTVRRWLQRSKSSDYVLVSNCDNLIDSGTVEMGMAMVEKCQCCVLFTFRPVHAGDTRFSYARRDTLSGNVIIREKEAISYDACAGVYAAPRKLLCEAIDPRDTYLSQSLERIPVEMLPVLSYYGFGDMQQLAELENGTLQYLTEPKE